MDNEDAGVFRELLTRSNLAENDHGKSQGCSSKIKDLLAGMP